MPMTIEILQQVLQAAEAQDYQGYSKFDALNSPFLLKLAFDNKWLQLLYTQVVKASPVNLRPWLGVRISRNPKGVALFARAYFFRYQQTRDPLFLKKGQALIQWLLDHPSPGQARLCWGYNFLWPSTLFTQARYAPNAVVTAFVGEALIHAFRVTQHEPYLAAAQAVAEFIVHDLPVLRDTADERAIAYVLDPVKAVVLNNQVLTAAFLAKVWKHTGKDHLLNVAQRQINYTVNRRTSYDAWYYTDPKGKSPIQHDNYHTGGILDGLLEYYQESGDDRYMNVYGRGLQYYQKHLFEANGAPRWMNTRRYPYDVHGAAQGIISFTKAAKQAPEFLAQARKIRTWAIAHLYRPDSHDFAYRISRWGKWNYSLMRWCNAWMSRAMAEMLATEEREK